MQKHQDRKGTDVATSGEVDSSTEKQQFIRETREFWEKRTGQSITDEDAREIIANVTGFFKVIAKWDSRAKEKKQGW